MADFRSTQGITLNANATTEHSFRIYGRSKTCTVNTWNNVISFQITSAPSVQKGFIAYYRGAATRASGTIAENFLRIQYWAWRINTNSTWSNTYENTVYQLGNVIAAFEVISEGGSTLNFRAYPYTTNAIIDGYLEIMSNGWDSLTITYP